MQRLMTTGHLAGINRCCSPGVALRVFSVALLAAFLMGIEARAQCVTAPCEISKEAFDRFVARLELSSAQQTVARDAYEAYLQQYALIDTELRKATAPVDEQLQPTFADPPERVLPEDVDPSVVAFFRRLDERRISNNREERVRERAPSSLSPEERAELQADLLALRFATADVANDLIQSFGNQVHDLLTREQTDEFEPAMRGLRYDAAFSGTNPAQRWTFDLEQNVDLLRLIREASRPDAELHLPPDSETRPQLDALVAEYELWWDRNARESAPERRRLHKALKIGLTLDRDDAIAAWKAIVAHRIRVFEQQNVLVSRIATQLEELARSEDAEAWRERWRRANFPFVHGPAPPEVIFDWLLRVQPFELPPDQIILIDTEWSEYQERRANQQERWRELLMQHRSYLTLPTLVPAYDDDPRFFNALADLVEHDAELSERSIKRLRLILDAEHRANYDDTVASAVNSWPVPPYVVMLLQRRPTEEDSQ